MDKNWALIGTNKIVKHFMSETPCVGKRKKVQKDVTQRQQDKRKAKRSLVSPADGPEAILNPFFPGNS